MITALVAISDNDLSMKFISAVLPLAYCGLDGAEFVRLADQVGWKKLEEPLGSLFTSQDPDNYRADLRSLVAIFESLCCHGPKLSAHRKSVCKSLANAVEETIDRWDQRRVNSWTTDHRIDIVEPVVRGYCAIGNRDHLKRLIARVTGDPVHYELHTVLIPAVKNLLDDQGFSGPSAPKLSQSATMQLHLFCVDELKRRTESKPTPPSDWRRTAKLQCKCSDCREIAKFLNDKNAETLRLPRRADLRQHLHHEIDEQRLDLAHTTERRGRPYTLVCTKNQASFEKALAQFKTDQELLNKLESR
jgi:hypothetical protein